jgi:CheY-like chemotaxis protein
MITKGLEVLIVDDNGMNRKLFAMLLKKMGNVTDEADSGAECLEMVGRKKYDLIFMDHMMPEMDGIETLNRMKALEQSLNRGTPVVALTANDMNNGKEFYLDAGFNGYLEKPVLPQKLEEMIQIL